MLFLYFAKEIIVNNKRNNPMEWMKEGLKLLISRSDKEQKEFEKYNSLLVLSRIRLISLAAIFLSIFWAYMDWTIIKNGADGIYSVTLVVMHIISVAASAAFLIFYRRITGKRKNKNYRIIYNTLKIYVFLYILFGAISSINSQRYTGNIYSYIILSLIAAIAFTLKPSYMLFAFGVNHMIFLTGIGILCREADLFLAKMINATVLAGAAFLLGFIFYRQRMKEFFYRKKLVENEENFKKLFYVNPYPVFITRLDDGKIIEANRRACSLLEINAEVLDSLDGIDCYIKNDSRLALQEELKEHNSTFDRIVEYEFKGKQMWVTANYELIDYHGEKCILTGIMDITEIRRAEEELSHYASFDSLTGILNRRMGLKKMEELLEEAQEDFMEFVLCFLDINNLKDVNDTYGHGEGDRYILTFCNMIKNKLNEEDIFFRMGGDEFIIVFRNKNKSQAENIWDEFVKQFDERNVQGEFPYNITASHGLFYYCTGMDIDLEQMIEKADKQMYKEKQSFKREYQTKDGMD
ncbi:sensor domain-containing diguanylate cyclase [Anaerocolumna xylanovorans]|uniref:PAS domain S-box-containing protein/diguanylate cyclase (GGDEF) domain-containing protein n=1 Tax=Anaerocolumna xylanovorans DSM 12503 TaxID=1121345 RepID=A0A1M7Y091_9FIRM|nr:diguanylate cyclase [Anaerocolumna xylanovorans]SHO44725.1 PAS domain S-box-containing protein/diguanylate cyclase (GGDEF) domain-containing protein [Anaerocolumna xylanovorans DSM 12503]